MKLPTFIEKIAQNDFYRTLVMNSAVAMLTALIFLSITHLFQPKLETDAQKELKLEIKKSFENDRIQDLQILDLHKQIKESQAREFQLIQQNGKKIDSIVNLSFDAKYMFLLQRARSNGRER